MNTVVTHSTGGRAQPALAVYIPPDRQVADAGSTTALGESGLDAAFVADMLSAFLAHERCGVHLYRSVAARTVDPELREQYKEFGRQTLEHAARLEQLIGAAGGDPQYVSASARATEKAASALLESTFIAAGSIDTMTAELVMLEAVMLAEAKDWANWTLLDQLTAQLPEGSLRSQFETVVSDVIAQEEDHSTWAAASRAALLMSLAAGGTFQQAASSSRDVTEPMERESEIGEAGQS